MSDAPPVLRLKGVTRVIGDTTVLDGIDFSVTDSQRWVVLGPNGCGKTTLIRVASMWLHPSKGSVEVLGETLGHVDVRRHRSRIGLTSAAMADMLRPTLGVVDVVKTAINAALEPWWHQYCISDEDRARVTLDRVGIGHLADRRFVTLSSGERQRVLLARALFAEPGLILLDEPTAALDLAGRESLLRTLDDLARDAATPPIVLVTHHVEEIPASFTHLLLMTQGRILAQGSITETLTEANLTACFGIDLKLQNRDGRWWAWAR